MSDKTVAELVAEQLLLGPEGRRLEALRKVREGTPQSAEEIGGIIYLWLDRHDLARPQG